jgi:hypothetical protein
MFIDVSGVSPKNAGCPLDPPLSFGAFPAWTCHCKKISTLCNVAALDILYEYNFLLQMRQLEESLERLNGRLQSGRLSSRKPGYSTGHIRPYQPYVSRTAGYAQKTRVKQALRSSPHKEGPPCPLKQPDKMQSAGQQKHTTCTGFDRWEDAHSVDYFVKHDVSPDGRLVRTKGGTQSRHSRAGFNVMQCKPAPGLPTPQEAQKLWRHIITAGMMATFGTAAVPDRLGGWDSLALLGRRSNVGAEPLGL